MAPKLYRRCLSCQRLACKSEFLRVVRVYSATVEPAQRIEIDRGMGRSAYICPTSACVQQAQKKNRLGRSLRAQIPPEIFAQLQALLNNEIGNNHY